MALRTRIFPKDELYNKYINDGLSTTDIAEFYSCSVCAISRNLKDYNIPMRKGADAKYSPQARIKRLSKHQNLDIIPRQILYDEYINQHLSMSHLASIHNCSRGKIRRSLRVYNIVTSNISPRHNIPKDELLHKYCNLLESVLDIANYYNCSVQTICNKLRKYDISVRPYKTCKNTPAFRKKMRSHSKFLNIPKDTIYQYYIIEQKSYQEIANIYGCTHEMIIRLAEEYGIQSRNPKEMHTRTIRQRISSKKKIFYQTPEGKEQRKLIAENTSRRMLGRTGELSPSWMGGISYLPYTQNFNKQFKLQIHQLYNYTCQLCGKEYTLNTKPKPCIHHINYNKTDDNINNYVPLCHSCHGKTNGKNKRIYYNLLFDLLRLNQIHVWSIYIASYNRISYN
ncbi:MAG: HNH endonuclease [Patescibacteria group bacterium]